MKAVVFIVTFMVLSSTISFADDGKILYGCWKPEDEINRTTICFKKDTMYNPSQKGFGYSGEIPATYKKDGNKIIVSLDDMTGAKLPCIIESGDTLKIKGFVYTRLSAAETKKLLQD